MTDSKLAPLVRTLTKAEVTAALHVLGGGNLELGAEGDPAFSAKLGHRVMEYIVHYRVEEEPEEMAPWLVGASPNNRGGADPNLPRIHVITFSLYQYG